MKTSKIDDQVAKNAHLHQALEAALRDLENHAGQEGYRHLYDKVVHILVAVEQAGFSIVRRRSKQ